MDTLVAEIRRLAERLLSLNGTPRPIELSVLSLSQLHPWTYPTPYDFHVDWDSRHSRHDLERFVAYMKHLIRAA